MDSRARGILLGIGITVLAIIGGSLIVLVLGFAPAIAWNLGVAISVVGLLAGFVWIPLVLTSGAPDLVRGVGEPGDDSILLVDARVRLKDAPLFSEKLKAAQLSQSEHGLEIRTAGREPISLAWGDVQEISTRSVNVPVRRRGILVRFTHGRLLFVPAQGGILLDGADFQAYYGAIVNRRNEY